MPASYKDITAIPAFVRQIVAATKHVAAAYKINTAFFEQYGAEGIKALYEVRDVVGDAFCVIDGKRADIGNTSAAYARFLFDTLQANAVTVAPYMGYDSVAPFIDRGVTYLLALTSNQGSADFQRKLVQTSDGMMPLYQNVMQTALLWKGANNIGFVVGATHPEELASIRTVLPHTPLLLPGIGAQGAEARATAEANGGGTALFNVGRAILYADSAESFAETAKHIAETIAADLSQ